MKKNLYDPYKSSVNLNVFQNITLKKEEEQQENNM